MQPLLRNWIIAFLIGGVCFPLFRPLGLLQPSDLATQIAAEELSIPQQEVPPPAQNQLAASETIAEPTTQSQDAPDANTAAATPAGPHSLQVHANGFSLLRVTIDGKPVFNGQIKPGTKHNWSGTDFVLWASNSGAVEVLLDARFAGRLGAAKDAAGLRWPTEHELPRTFIDLENPPSGPVIPLYYIVQSGDSLSLIAQGFALETLRVAQANGITDADQISSGMRLAIPSRDGQLPDKDSPQVAAFVSDDELTALANRPTILERQTKRARQAPRNSPYYKTTWVTYYGRPNTPVMGILGEYDVETLAGILKDQAEAYDEANGKLLSVTPAFHLVYGMATKWEGEDGSHLAFMADDEVESYIKVAQRENFAVILDIQIGALTPADSIEKGLPWLKYDNVHLGIDPEFAKVHPGQEWPGLPIGYVTAEQVNEVQRVIRDYMVEHKIKGPRVLLVHQFQDDMIHNKAALDWSIAEIDLTLSVDGWGPPSGKIHKYNALVDNESEFSAFKLFYSWDEPLMNEAQALGEEPFGAAGIIEITPNMIIYQ
ncbi:MAG: DUF4115 domain-containing protein [Caldilineaceae bacterium]